jgi:hypothetical protein
MSDDTDSGNDLYLVWSHEHGRWWGPGGCGYVTSLSAAGRYNHRQALDICTKAIPGNAVLPELPVRLRDVQIMRDRYLSEYSFLNGPWI